MSLRGLDDANAYLHRDDGTYNDDSGCGNVSNPADANIRQLVLTALDRFADLGIDGFRFDLASLLTRDGGGLVERITQWAAERGVRLIAEPWDLAAYQVGQWPDAVAAVERPLPRRGPRLRARRARPGAGDDATRAGQPRPVRRRRRVAA